jgi:hypothetical protein
VAKGFESDDWRERLPALLQEASGYRVFDLRGRRIGFVIGLADDPESGEQRLAIRRDGVFLWRRRLLPLEAVENADAVRSLVVVDEEREPADQATSHEATTAGGPAPGSRDEAEPSLLCRLEHYTRPENRADVGEADRVLDEAEHPAQGPSLPSHHLRFVSAPSGYRLSDREGEPPTVGTRISGTDAPEPLVVVKLGPSPLPNDPRVCAFLERDNPFAPPPSR